MHVTDAQTSYALALQDEVRTWMRRYTQRSGWTPSKDLYKSFIDFANNERALETIPDDKAFGIYLSIFGIAKARNNRGSLRNLSLLPPTQRQPERKAALIKTNRRFFR